MAADAGAQQILELLNQGSSQLHDDAVAFAEAQRKAFKKPYGVMPQYGVTALANMRAYCRDVRQQISAIETVDVKSKAEALKALDKLDRQFDLYESSLELGISKQAMPKLKKSKQVGKVAGAGLRRTIAGLK